MGSILGRDIPKLLKLVLGACHSDVRGIGKTGSPDVKIMCQGVISWQISGASYFIEAALKCKH